MVVNCYKIYTEQIKTALLSKVVDKVRNIKIKDGVNLHYIEDTKFKTTTLGVYIHTPLSRENASLNALLPMVLRRGSESYQSFEQIEKRLADLCGAVLNTGVVKRGEDQILCFDISTISDKYYIEDENILFSCADLLFDIILKPKTENEAFCDEYVSGEKENLCDMIDALVNDKQSYALWRLYEIMCSKERYGIHEYGTKQSVISITPKSLFEHDNKLISESKIDIFVCGKTNIDAFEKKVCAIFKTIKTSDATYPSTQKISTVGEVKKVVEEFDTNQAKLSLGFRVTRDVDYVHMLVANSIWGSGPHSKLFNNVREKYSLAYYAFSRFDKHKNTILVGMGIETKNYQKAFDETMLQLKNVCEGDFAENELVSAKAFLINLFRSQRDSQYAMISFHLGMLIGGVEYDIDELCERINDVTAEQIASVAKAIVLDTEYFLKGRE